MIRKVLLFTFILSCIAFYSDAQVTAVSTKLVQKENNQYDVYLVIKEGQSRNTKDRIQFNSQISFVMPKGSEFKMVERYMPLKDHQNYKGTEPMEWQYIKPTKSPAIMPDAEFYAVRPILMPTCLFNDLKAGDEIKLFTIQVNDVAYGKVRFFENGVDPDSDEPSMGGAEFFIGYCIGGVKQLYTKN